MDSFDVVISPKALSQLNHYIDNVQFTLLNDQAAFNVWQDAMETRDQLSKVAGSLTPSSHPLLKKTDIAQLTFSGIIILWSIVWKIGLLMWMLYTINFRTMKIFLRMH